MRLTPYAITAIAMLASAQPPTITYATLAEGQILAGFRAAAVYLNDADRPMGARFVHLKSGFTLDLLEIQSVPQAWIWTTTYPTSNMGEPHTQEHLLLGKGGKGRAVANLEPMALTDSTALTLQWRTCYSFYTSAGTDVFFDQTEKRLDAMLHPNYTDEEVRREVRNFGISENPRDKSLRLEEKGTVYNEMVSSMDQPGYRIYRAAGGMVYGPEHPLAFNSGGSPEALRVMQPADIRKFHQNTYHLANMGMIASLAAKKDVELTTVLARMGGLLDRVQPRRPFLPVVAEKDLPKPQPAPAGEIRMVEYPHRNERQPGSVYFVWPAERTLDPMQRELLDLFLGNLAGDASTNLYKRFIDSRTRTMDLGAKSVSAHASPDLGQPVTVAFGDVPVERMNPGDLASLRSQVRAELDRIAAWKDGSPELREFQDRMRSALTDERRQLSKFVNSPPTFGFRRANTGWMQQLDLLNRGGGFRKSLTLKPELAAVEALLAGERNIWAEYLPKWKLTGTEPWALAAKPNPELIRQEQTAREARAKAELARLRERYGVPDEQEALRRYRADYDAATAIIDHATAQATPPKFVDHPPLTLDGQLDYKVTKLPGGVPLVASTFDSMTSATAGIALRLDGVPQASLVYLTLLPQLMTRVGVIENGKPVPYEEMSERLKKEILGLSAGFAGNPSTGRAELTVHGSGNDDAESQKALAWMDLVMFHPDWRPENLPRIRDVVDQALSGLRRTMQSPEEYWVQGPATSWWKQDEPLTLLANSFMTRTHNVHRLRWMLKEASPGTRIEVSRFLDSLATATGERAARKALLAEVQAGKAERLQGLTDAAKALAIDAAKDLEITLPDIPDSSLTADWAYLCRQMRNDLNVTPAKALEALGEVRRTVLKAGGARMTLVASAATQRKLAPGIASLVARLDTAPPVKATYSRSRVIAERLQQRDATAANPVFVGLVNANSQGGVFLHSAPLAGYTDTDREKLLEYLSTNLYGGRGAHGIFMKTWAAGLAYSNGIRVRPADGRLNYYAERTPELPQTLKFVVGELKRAPKPGNALVEYAIAESFAGTRSASPYESRGEAMAADLADGKTPEVVARFHRALLDLRQVPDLPGELYRRMNVSYGRVLPGLSGKTADVKDGVYLVIGPEKQLAAWEEYLKTTEGPDTRLFRLYPRDFWVTAE
jgi:Zn-dependent M16 (insulinase) family peptidase